MLSPNGPELATNVLARLISYIHHTSGFKQYCHVGNTAQQCKLGLFQTLTLPEILKTRNRLQEDFCAHLEVIHVYQQVGCARNKTSVSHSSTEAEIFLLMQVYALMGFQISIFGIQLLKC